jgi:CheY-like chemotaxis protein
MPRVLVVDDNHDDADSLKILLGLWGHEAHAVYSAFAGLWAAKFLRPDIILVDVRLPGALDGLGVTRLLRREPATARLRFIAITGYPDEKILQLADESGVEHVLVKPVNPPVLERLLQGAA